ncbi:MAG: hypothetical protein ACXV8U_14325 [Methylobacter sp.]
MNVFFNGYGVWFFESSFFENEKRFSEFYQVSDYYKANGVFDLNEEDAIRYKYTNNIDDVDVLIPCFHEASEMTKLSRVGVLYSGDDMIQRHNPEITEEVKQHRLFQETIPCYHPESEWAAKIRQKRLKGEAEGFVITPYDDTKCFFKVDRSKPYSLSVVENNLETAGESIKFNSNGYAENCSSDDTKVFSGELDSEYLSVDLKLLYRAALEFWSTAEPDNKSTHPTNKEVENWLKQQGFSDINAKQGAVIIRPKWGAKGRR